MSAEEDARMLEAVLCTLLAREGGPITLPAREIAAFGNRYRLDTLADHQALTVTLALLPARPRPARHPRPSRPRRSIRPRR